MPCDGPAASDKYGFIKTTRQTGMLHLSEPMKLDMDLDSATQKQAAAPSKSQLGLLN